MTPWPTKLLMYLLPVLAAAPATAQRLQLAATRPPYYVGEPIQIQISARGFEESPEPECTFEEQLPAGLTAQLIGVTPSVSESITNINGRITRTRRVVFQFVFQVVADRGGDFQFGPVTVKQGATEVRAEAVTLQFRDVEFDDNMRVSLELPEEAVYEGQRVPVVVRWAYAGDLRTVRNLSIRAPLFEQFEFVDPVAQREDNLLPIQTPEGPVSLPAEVASEIMDGKRFTVLTAQRTLLADRPGTYDLSPITASMRRGDPRPRDLLDEFFDDSIFRRGRNRAASVPVKAQGEPRQLVIKPLPTQGRPESFAGAVGDGFSLDVQANRTVVRVGDPISLNVTLRGQGNLQQARIPSLSADGGMSPAQFRLPNVGDIAGAYQQGEKQFHVTIRVNDETVGEIPALAFSWFDPHAEEYRTTRSKPIALRVMPAQVVSSEDVVRGAVAEAHTAPSPDEDPVGGGPAPPSSQAVAGADFAIESDPARLLTAPRKHRVTNYAPAALYVVGVAALALAVIDRRRRQVDPDVARRRRVVKEQQSRIRVAAKLPAGRAADEVAAALRRLLPVAPAALKHQAESLIGQLEARIYAPDHTDDQKLPGELLIEAQRLSGEIGQNAS